MNSKLVFLFYFLCCEGIGTQAGVSLLVEKDAQGKGSPLNSSNAMSGRKTLSDKGTSEKILLTKEKGTPGCWRTDKGELVKLLPVVEFMSKPVSVSSEGVGGRSTDMSSAQVTHSFDSTAASNSKSNRSQRTFWPFTSLFGYDYMPPPPIYGPIPPPYGFGYPPAPPPPFFFGGGYW